MAVVQPRGALVCWACGGENGEMEQASVCLKVLQTGCAERMVWRNGEARVTLDIQRKLPWSNWKRFFSSPSLLPPSFLRKSKFLSDGCGFPAALGNTLSRSGYRSEGEARGTR